MRALPAVIGEPCPECEGKCCRDNTYWYKIEHMSAECYEHTCDHCQDGTKYTPPRTAEDERNSILVWIRAAAKATRTRHAYMAVMQVADGIERGEHLKEDL